MLCISCTCKTSMMTKQCKQFPCYNLQNGLICTCHRGGEGEREVVTDIGGANQCRTPDFGPSAVDISKKTVWRLSHFGKNKAKDFTCCAKRIFTFSSEVFSLTFRKALLSSSSSSSSSLVWMAFLKLESNWNQMFIRNCLKPFLFFYKSHNTLNITITRVTPEE